MSALNAAAAQPHLTFTDLQLSVDVGFWEELRKLKLTLWKLDEPYAPLKGILRVNVSDRVLLSPPNLVHLSASSLHPSTSTLQSLVSTAEVVNVEVRGTVKNYSLADGLHSIEPKNFLFSSVAESLLKPVVASYDSQDEEAKAWANIPLCTLCMYTYVDAKAYRFYHCEAFPSIAIAGFLRINSSVQGLSDALPFSPSSAQLMYRYGIEQLQQHPERFCCPFLADCTGDKVELQLFSPRGYVTLTSSTAGTAIVCVFDFSDAAGSVSTPVRNLITCMRLAAPSLTSLRVYALRVGGPEQSVFVDLSFDRVDEAFVCALRSRLEASTIADMEHLPWKMEFPALRISGWRKKQTEILDLGGFIDPVRRAESDSRFNLELMKWRVLPSLALDRLAECKVLLLGTGTLGCNVARNLLMWGVRNLTLVDRGHVSFSNLARQSLFSFEAAKENKLKVDAAAEALRSIIPSVAVHPVPLMIHMPGHRIDEDKVKEALADICRLEELIISSDVVFLLTDSREARWMPSIIAAAVGTPIVNVALGFDTYVVMRHGIPTRSSSSNAVGPFEFGGADATDSAIGCYFCSDVVAPTDSLSFRALDEQCTVTRPAVSSIASAIAVELLVELYQHPAGFRCPAFRESASAHSDKGKCRLGVIPQQIRGSVFSHTMHHLYGERNPFCTACADKLLCAYKEGGKTFLLQCVNAPLIIEEICGVKELKEKWVAEMEEAHWSSEDDDGE